MVSKPIPEDLAFLFNDLFQTFQSQFRVERGYSDNGAIPIIFFSFWEKLHNYPKNSLFKRV